MQLDKGIYEILEIFSFSLTDKTHLKDLFDKTIFQYDKELLGFNEPVVFIFNQSLILLGQTHETKHKICLSL